MQITGILGVKTLFGVTVASPGPDLFQDTSATALWCFSESSKEEFASTNIADELVRLFRKQTEHEKKEMIFEVLAPLAENGNMIFFLSRENKQQSKYLMEWYEMAGLPNLSAQLMNPGMFKRTKLSSRVATRPVQYGIVSHLAIKCCVPC